MQRAHWQYTRGIPFLLVGTDIIGVVDSRGWSVELPETGVAYGPETGEDGMDALADFVLHHSRDIEEIV